MDAPTEQEKVEKSKTCCQAPRRTLDKTHLQLEPSDINQAEKVQEARKTRQEMERCHQRILTINQNQQRQQRSHDETIWLTTAQGGSKRDSMESDSVSSRLDQYDPRPPSSRQRQPNQQHQDEQRTRQKSTTTTKTATKTTMMTHCSPSPS